MEDGRIGNKVREIEKDDGYVCLPKSSTGHEIMSLNNKVTYRATKLWLEAVEMFRSGVQLGKHRALFRQYDQCFVAEDAVSWFHLELQQRFDKAITRQQTVHLLQKLYKAGVFSEVTNQSSVNSSKPLTAIKETDFKDNKRLYKLVQRDEATAENGSASTSNASKSDYYVVIKQLSMAQIYEIWENAFVERFVQVVGYDVYTSFLKPGSVHGFRINHNMTKISPNGIVLAPSPLDELPSWIMSAMKCVTQGEASVDFEHTNYPGFQNDVFRLIRDYFNTFKDAAPLLTFELHDAFITTFIRAALFNGSKPGTVSRKSGHVARRVPRRSGFLEEKYPFNRSESTENLLLDMFTPSPDKETNLTRVDVLKKKVNPRRILEMCPTKSPVVDENIEPMEEKSYDLNRYKKIVTTVHVHAATAEDPVFLETAFTSERSPITRVISKAEIECSLGALRVQNTLTSGKASSATAVNFAYENPVLELSPADLVNHPKYSRILRAAELNTTSKVSSNASFEASLQTMAAHSTGGQGEDELTRSLDNQLRVSTKGSQRPYRSYSAVNLSDENQDRSFEHVPQAPRSRGSVDMAEEPGVPQFLFKKYVNSPNKSARKTMKLLSGTKLRMSLMSPEGKEFAIVSFRLLTLLLPSQNRRYLHLLLQFMAKMAEKDKLMLDVGNTTRAIVINEFSRAILGCVVEKEYDEYLAHQIVSFLMDNNREVFDVVKEEALKKTAEAQITEQQIEKIPMNVNTKLENGGEKEDKENKIELPRSATCHKISLDEYESQRLLGTTAPALRELLTACHSLADGKERKRQLKKFRNEYPHIFAEKYGEGDGTWLESSSELEAATPEPKKRSRKILRALF